MPPKAVPKPRQVTARKVRASKKAEAEGEEKPQRAPKREPASSSLPSLWKVEQSPGRASARQDLAAGFKQYGVRSWENPIPIVVPREYVNVNALSQRMSEGECPPVIEWTPAAQGKFIEIAGGHHRWRSVEVIANARRSVQYISRNEEMPSVKRTDLERFWMGVFNVQEYHSLWRANPHKEVRGGADWLSHWENLIVALRSRAWKTRRGLERF
ncbi:hypothetical protein BD414DRAFT_511124 [Trametes punicea]|nr:hypothetical protein BD414DRAFT_511124 [Trametes punicea]